jgi:hypothetical protein
MVVSHITERKQKMTSNNEQTLVSTPDLGMIVQAITQWLNMDKEIQETVRKTSREIAELWHPVFSVQHADWYLFTSKNAPKDDKGVKEVLKRQKQFVEGLVAGGINGSTARTALQRIREHAMKIHKPEAHAALVVEREKEKKAMSGTRAKKDFAERCEADISPVIRMGDALADSDMQAKEIVLLKALKAAFKAAGINWVKAL